MRSTNIIKTWLQYALLYGSVFAALGVVVSLILGGGISMQLLHYSFFLASFGGMLAFLQCRRDAQLPSRSSHAAGLWLLSTLWFGVFYYFSLTMGPEPMPEFASNAILALLLGGGLSLVCLVPISWIVMGISPGKFSREP